MPFDIHIPENSLRGRVIQQMIEAQHITPEQVLEQIIDAGIREQQAKLPAPAPQGKRPADMFLGWFANSEEATAVMDDITQMVYEDRKKASTRDIGL